MIFWGEGIPRDKFHQEAGPLTAPPPQEVVGNLDVLRPFANAQQSNVGCIGIFVSIEHQLQLAQADSYLFEMLQ